MTKQGILEKQAKNIFLGIGSNLGNRLNNIEKAKYLLFQNNIEILQSSRFYESLSWPNSNNPKFLNVVLKVKTGLDPRNLLNLCKNIEFSLGRRKRPQNFPRECDIDILDYNKKIFKNGVNLPHPRMINRNFVLLPLFEIDKNWVHPVSKQHIKTLILGLSKKDLSSIKHI